MPEAWGPTEINDPRREEKQTDGPRRRICSGILHGVFIGKGKELRSSPGRNTGGNDDNRKRQTNHC